VLIDLAVMIADGGEAICDIDVLRHQQGVFGPVASDTTGAYVAERLFLDPDHGADTQRLWLGLLRGFADRVNPGFGQVEYGFDTNGATALEWSLPTHVRLEAG
jgi:hypothetical protein